MTDKTLAEQIRALKIPDDFTDEEATGYWQATHDAAALADAAPPAEQAGDVGQAWRVKPLVWHTYDAWTWWAESTSGTYRVEERNGTWRATLNLPMTEHIIYEYETDGTPNDFEAAHLACESDHAARITAALEPDPTPALAEALRLPEVQELVEAANDVCDDRITPASDEGFAKSVQRVVSAKTRLRAALTQIGGAA